MGEFCSKVRASGIKPASQTVHTTPHPQPYLEHLAGAPHKVLA